MAKVILITGGSSGIGKSIGDFLSNQNFIVYGTSRNPSKVASSFSLIQLDVTKPETIKEAVATILKKEGRLDILINNAGVGITGPIEETPEEEIKNAFNTNYHGPLQVIKAVLPTMRKQNQGLIINITSIAGYMGLPYRGIYSATKAALEITTEAYRMELQQFGIKMVNVAPGDFATNIAAGRYHSPVLKNSPYQEDYSKTLSIMDAHVDKGENPVKMAEVVHKIIQKNEPKVRYVVGARMQKFSIFLKKIVPSKLYEKMLLSHYKL